MLKKEKGPEGAKSGPGKDPEADEKDHAYEDSWYRSLKASAANRSNSVDDNGTDKEEEDRA